MLNKYEVDGVTVAMNSIMDSGCSVSVFSFLYENDCGNSEWEIQRMEHYNSETDKFRIKMFAAGWWWAIDLPYEALPGGGLIVKWQLDLDEETTFEHPWDYPTNGYDLSPSARESFYPPIPINHPGCVCKSSVGDDGFVEDSFLYWHWDFEED